MQIFILQRALLSVAWTLHGRAADWQRLRLVWILFFLKKAFFVKLESSHRRIIFMDYIHPVCLGWIFFCIIFQLYN